MGNKNVYKSPKLKTLSGQVFDRTQRPTSLVPLYGSGRPSGLAAGSSTTIPSMGRALAWRLPGTTWTRLSGCSSPKATGGSRGCDSLPGFRASHLRSGTSGLSRATARWDYRSRVRTAET